MSPNSTDTVTARRSFLFGAISGGALLAMPRFARSATTPLFPQQLTTGSRRSLQTAVTDSSNLPIPPVIRSRNALLRARNIQAGETLPLTQYGTTYDYVQVARWLDADHFALGRWDGTMSIFQFNTAPYVGALVTEAVNTPSSSGVQMLTLLPPNTIATSNDDASLLLWVSRSGKWSDLNCEITVPYDQSLGVATSGAWFRTGLKNSTLVVGHSSGFVTLWSFDSWARKLYLLKTLDVRNPNPVNPFDSHYMYGMCPLVESGPNATVICGSDDGYISIIKVPSGMVLSQTVFNPSAQRGINSVSALGRKLLVANCSVGSADRNLWYYDVDPVTGKVTLLDSMNLIIDTQRPQSFNFDVTWGQYSGGPCWFAGTEEGALWMGTADTKLNLIGQQSLADGAIGAALAFTQAPGRLVASIHSINQFSTGSA